MGLLDKILGPPSRDRFASLMIAGLREAGDRREVHFDKDEYRLCFEEDGEDRGVLNLTNLYIEFCNVDKSDRKQCIKEMVRAALSHLKEMPEDFEDASYDIRPRLWTRSTFELLKLRQQLENGNPVDWPLEMIGEHLFLSIVYDLPESVRSISTEDLEQWGVTFWETREIAIHNLAESKFVYANVGNELYASNTQDSYDATRLMLPELFNEFEVEGQHIAMVPNRDTLLVTGTESVVGQKMMIEFATQQLQEQPRPMIATPLLLQPDGTWTDWIPPTDNPLYSEFERLRLGWLQIEYEDQKQLLEKIYEIQLNDDFVASFTVATKDDDVHSYCVWSAGVKSVLPRADFLVFYDVDSGESRRTRWEDAVEVVGDLMEPMDLYPPRYRVFDFPDAKQLAQIPEQAL